jgi:adenylosuccinate lyase
MIAHYRLGRGTPQGLMPQLRINDPGARALFTESARFQSWLDVEAALALAQAELSIIPAAAARKIVRKTHLSYLEGLF